MLKRAYLRDMPLFFPQKFPQKLKECSIYAWDSDIFLVFDSLVPCAPKVSKIKAFGVFLCHFGEKMLNVFMRCKGVFYKEFPQKFPQKLFSQTAHLTAFLHFPVLIFQEPCGTRFS